ncbi:autotransporter outer membrane beta-barrel domain-containing protein [Roseovarius amoyensis]|uniref:autotransporter outer membrane beta-barrel domain-containing protein n=1 Tax=Roseovarius amoyensis TaxID=2211448 RepID=UPI0013A6A37E|nr:autotransporter outer membrane beta-barrel domain-containing protein [Roseovarius amoyensis]
MSDTLARIHGLLIALALLAGLPSGALAYNVPGSAQAHVSELTEIATGIIVKSLREKVRPLRQQGDGARISTQGSLSGVSAIGAGRVPISFSLTHRLLDTSTLDGRLDVATLLLGGGNGRGMVYFGGLIGENGDVRTPRDNGKIKHTGAGLAMGADFAVSEQFFITAMMGGMSLDYDVARGGGAIVGSFGASRYFADLSADYVTRSAMGDLTLGFGLLYVNQHNDGYIESGGAAVAPYTFDQLAATLEMRNTWGQAGTFFRPYVDLSAQIRLAGSSGSTVAVVPVHSDNQARLFVGVERMAGRSTLDVGLGTNFDDSGYSGLDGRVNYSFRF